VCVVGGCVGVDSTLGETTGSDAGSDASTGDDDASDENAGVTTGYMVTTFAGSTTGASGSLDSANPLEATFNGPRNIALGPNGSLYVVDYGNHKIRKIASNGAISTLAGKGGPPPATYADGACLSATFYYPRGIAVDRNGIVYIADESNFVIRVITPSPCTVTTLAGSGTSGDVPSDTGTATGTVAAFGLVQGLALDAAGDFLYVADYTNNKVRRVTLKDTLGQVLVTNGVVSTVAGKAKDADGNNAGHDNGLALSGATFTAPFGIAVDAKAGILYVSENHDIRTITNGQVNLLAGSTDGSSGNLIDGTGSNARFYRPYGLALDADGNLIVADAANHAVRKVTPDGVVTTFAGTRDDVTGAGTSGAKDGPANEATFSSPYGLAVDPNTGVIYVSDADNNNIRKITPCTAQHPCATP